MHPLRECHPFLVKISELFCSIGKLVWKNTLHSKKILVKKVASSTALVLVHIINIQKMSLQISLLPASLVASSHSVSRIIIIITYTQHMPFSSSFMDNPTKPNVMWWVEALFTRINTRTTSYFTPFSYTCIYTYTCTYFHQLPGFG